MNVTPFRFPNGIKHGRAWIDRLIINEGIDNKGSTMTRIDLFSFLGMTCRFLSIGSIFVMDESQQ